MTHLPRRVLVARKSLDGKIVGASPTRALAGDGSSLWPLYLLLGGAIVVAVAWNVYFESIEKRMREEGRI